MIYIYMPYALQLTKFSGGGLIPSSKLDMHLLKL